jgi:ABC-type amino acid transport substrate-binding protein
MQPLEPGILIVGAYAAFAPISWSDQGQAAGRDIDFLRGFAAQHGLTLQVRFFPFDRIWERPGRDECDLAAAGIAAMPSRIAPGVVWSDSYFTVQRGLLIRQADQQRLRTIDDFAEQTIAVTRGSTAELDVLARKPDSARVAYYDDQQQALADLAAGRIDAYGTGDVCCDYLADVAVDRYAVADVHPFEPLETFAFPVRAASQIIAPLNAYIANNRACY